MDTIPPSEGGGTGSIPVEGTRKEKLNGFGLSRFVWRLIRIQF